MLYINIFFTSLIILVPAVYIIAEKSEKYKRSIIGTFNLLVVLTILVLFNFFGIGILIHNDYPDFSYIAFTNGVVALLLPFVSYIIDKSKNVDAKSLLRAYQIAGFILMPTIVFLIFLYYSFINHDFDSFLFSTISYILFFNSMNFLFWFFPFTVYIILRDKIIKKFWP